MHRHSILVFAPSRGDSRIDHGDDWYAKLGRNAEEQSQLVAVHICGYRYDQSVTAMRDSSPNLLKLSAHEVSRAQVLEALVRERRSFQIKPESILNVARLDTRIREGRVAGLQFVVIQQRKTGLSIQDSFCVENRNSGVVEVCG